MTFMPCYCPSLTCFTCYARTIFKAIVLINESDEKSISDYIMNNYTGARRSIVKTVIKFLLDNNILEAKSAFMIVEPENIAVVSNSDLPARIEVARELVENQYRDRGELLRQWVPEANSRTSRSSDLPDEDTIADSDSHRTSLFVCEVCNKVCSSAAGLGSHRRVHRKRRRNTLRNR